MARRPKEIEEEDPEAGRPPDADRLEGVLHPRETLRVLGHERAERAFLAAWNAQRPHHAWLLRGPPGIGKACFAYRLARFLLSHPPDEGGLLGMTAEPDTAASEAAETLDVPTLGSAARQIAAGSHPGLIELRRPWDEKTKRFRKEIGVAQVRKLLDFFQMSAADGGWRVAIVDPADDLNTAAANALLKMLEEPPERSIFLLVTHAPGRLLATIRSRARALDLMPLPGNLSALAMAEACEELDAAYAAKLDTLSPGSPGEALRLHRVGGLKAYGEILGLLKGLPQIDRQVLARLSSATAKDGADGMASTSRLLRLALERLARTGALGTLPENAVDGEGEMLRRLAPTLAAGRAWAEAAAEVSARLDRAQGLNLDTSRTLLDIAHYLEDVARKSLR